MQQAVLPMVGGPADPQQLALFDDAQMQREQGMALGGQGAAPADSWLSWVTE